jgi:CHASE3 domain sensor protein
VAVAIGLTVLAGWLFDQPALKSVLPGWVAMKASTAIGFLLAGSVVWLLPSAASADGSRLLLRALAAALIALAALSLSQDLFSWELGIDQLLFREAVGAVGTAHAGRMAPNTAVCFILIATSALLLALRPGPRRARVRLVVQCLSALVAGVAALALLSYAVGMPMVYRWHDLTPMAAPTALACLVLAIGLMSIALREDGDWAIDKRVTAAILLSLLLTLLISSLSARTAVNLQQANRLLAHTHQVRFQNSQILAALERMEAAQRGFLLTGQAVFLQPYAPAVRQVVAETAVLRRLTADTPAQQARLRLLDSGVAARLRYAAGTLQTYRLQGAQAAVGRVRLSRGLAQMRDIRALLNAVDAEELRLVRQRRAQLQGSSAAVFALLPLGGLLSLLILSVGMLYLNRDAA